jgi:hypothetical protein
MKLQKLDFKWAIVVAILAMLLGCSKSGENQADSTQGHFHLAPHGGALVMLGQHMAQIELVAEAGGKSWALYVLDGGAQRFVRVKQATVKASLDGRSGTFEAVENAATGESVGNTAKFTLKADWLDPEGRFPVIIDEIEVFGQTFSRIEFEFPEGKH